MNVRDSLYLRLVKGERPVVVRLSRPVVVGDFRFLVRIETTMPHLSHTQLSPPGSCFRGSVWHSGHNVSVVAIAGSFCRGILPPPNQGCQTEILLWSTRNVSAWTGVYKHLLLLWSCLTLSTLRQFVSKSVIPT